MENEDEVFCKKGKGYDLWEENNKDYNVFGCLLTIFFLILGTCLVKFILWIF